jgi:hypothetical protein
MKQVRQVVLIALPELIKMNQVRQVVLIALPELIKMKQVRQVVIYVNQMNIPVFRGQQNVNQSNMDIFQLTLLMGILFHYLLKG